jgi:cysteine desulfurase
MLPFLAEDFGNANSLHSYGRKAHAAVELARERVANLIGAEDPSQIVFTSGATEGNNWLLANFPDAVVSPYEHSSIREPATRMGLRTLLSAEERLMPLSEASSLLSVMTVNNETGTVWNASELRGTAERVHSDLTQAVGKIDIDVDGLDFATLSGHKIYGPKGVGALYIRQDFLNPVISGGGQELGRRAGTLNVPGIVGLGVAAEIASQERSDNYVQAANLQNLLIELLTKVPDMKINGGSTRSPFILSVSFFGVEGETLVLDADNSGYAISSGAACSSTNVEPSVVLKQMGLEDSWNRGTIRISLGTANLPTSAAGLASSLQYSIEKLRTMT